MIGLTPGWDAFEQLLYDRPLPVVEFVLPDFRSLLVSYWNGIAGSVMWAPGITAPVGITCSPF